MFFNIFTEDNEEVRKSSLERIQNLFKFWEVFSTFLFVFCLIACTCVTVFFFLTTFVDEINGVSLKTFMENTFKIGFSKQVIILLTGIFVIAGDAFLAFNTKKFFKKELKERTPFSYKVSKELRDLSFEYILVPIITNLVASLFVLFALERIPFIYFISLIIFEIIGLFLLTMSIVFRYGCEIRFQLVNKESAEE